MVADTSVSIFDMYFRSHLLASYVGGNAEVHPFERDSSWPPGFTNKYVHPCRPMSLISFHDLMGVAYTEEETNVMVAEIEVVDGPNDEGEMFTSPGKLSDHFLNHMQMNKQLDLQKEGPILQNEERCGDILIWATEPEMEERKLVNGDSSGSLFSFVPGALVQAGFSLSVHA
ncbi:hypothetical protein OROMI_032340 [Orobanche minor]